MLFRDNNPHNARDNRRLSAKFIGDYGSAMSMSFAEALSQALETTGISLRSLSAQAGVSYEQLKKVNQGKSLTTNVEDARLVAQAVGVTLDQFLNGEFDAKRPTIAIAGRVGAGARIPLFDAYEKGDGPQVEAPPQLAAKGVVAVEVVGDSMEPVYNAGDILFYTRDTADGVPDDVVGFKCVCEDMDGNTWVKQVRRGSAPGLFNLVSINPGADNQHDVRLKWAAKVKMHLPAELAVMVP